MVFVHVISRKEALFRKQRPYHKRTAFYVYDIFRSVPWQPQLIPGNIHNSRIPLLAVRVTENRISRIFSP